MRSSTKKLINAFKKNRASNPKTHKASMTHLRKVTKSNPSKAKSYRWAHARYG